MRHRLGGKKKTALATVTLSARFRPWQARIPDRLHPVPVLTSAASYDSAAAVKKGSSVDPCVSILVLIGVQTCIQKCGEKKTSS